MYSGKSLISVAILLACGTITVSARDCPKACTLEFNQVCASNGQEYRLFDNPCMMDAFNCEHEFLWTRTKSLAPCLADTTAISADSNDCIRPCTMEYTPTCAFDGEHFRLFDNICEMHNAECGTKNHYTLAKLYECVPHPAAYKLCEEPCTREYNPVCGFNGEEHKTFSNLCVMNNQHCKDNKVWQQTRMNECKIAVQENKHSCEKPCNRMYRPVCGTDGQTYKVFNNECLMENEHCHDHHEWKATTFALCENPIPLAVEPKKECIKICPRIYAPVCGTDGQTYQMFDNKCLMEKEQECDGHQWHAATFALCENPIPLAIAPKSNGIKMCPLIYAPVCGTDGQTYKLFNNKCFMENEKEFDGHHWHATTLALCENPIPLAVAPKKPCPMMCPLNYLPICAFNGKTHQVFSNDCELEQVNCQNNEHFMATLMSECEIAPKSSEETFVCPDNFDPQCGFDGVHYRVFENQCMIDSYNRVHKTTNFAHVDLSFCQNLLSF